VGTKVAAPLGLRLEIHPAPEPADTNVGVEQSNDKERLRLLIVEDDADQRQLIGETLEEHFGAQTVRCVASGAEALKLDLASFHLILTDFNLPGITGMELLVKIRAVCTTPVIMVTGENVTQFAAEAIRRGAMDYVVKFGDYLLTIPLVVQKNLAVAKLYKENTKLHADLEGALGELRRKNGQLEESLRMVEELAATDALTGLYNRRHFNRVLDQLFAESERMDTDLSCVMIDLDGYKQLNDTYGHGCGDQLLTAAGKVILANMRRMDVAARYGGDEFVLLFPHASASEAASITQRIREQFGQGSAILLRRNEPVTISAGIASRKGNLPSGAEQLVAVADKALYQAKDGGRNRIVVEQLPAIHEPPAIYPPGAIHGPEMLRGSNPALYRNR
jgi:diguanylate cyclase (GGDEF)-like protein